MAACHNDEELNIHILEEAGLLSPAYLSQETIDAINALSKDEIEALIRISKKMSLNTFFKAHGPEVQG